MMRRPFVLLSALLALACAYCNTDVGNADLIYSPVADGQMCSADGDCASDNCIAGTCEAPAGGLVEIDGRCDSGQTCVAIASCQGGICVPTGSGSGSSTSSSSSSSTSTSSGTTCTPDGSSCSSNSDCCNGSNCDDNVFQCSNSCGTSGTSCSQGTDCCSSVCASGTSTCI